MANPFKLSEAQMVGLRSILDGTAVRKLRHKTLDVLLRREFASLAAVPPPGLAVTPLGRYALFLATGVDCSVEGCTLPPDGFRSWKPEVIADSSGQWCGNALRFATKEEAEENVLDLSWRWLLVRETRVVASKDEVNYRWDKVERLVSVEPKKKEA